MGHQPVVSTTFSRLADRASMDISIRTRNRHKSTESVAMLAEFLELFIRRREPFPIDVQDALTAVGHTWEKTADSYHLMKEYLSVMKRLSPDCEPKLDDLNRTYRFCRELYHAASRPSIDDVV